MQVTNGQDQVYEGVSVLLRHATPVAYILQKHVVHVKSCKKKYDFKIPWRCMTRQKLSSNISSVSVHQHQYERHERDVLCLLPASIL